jgi:hypothetical protein
MRYSIEFGHIYTDESFNHEHELSVEAVLAHRRSLGSDHSASSVVLVDDYNATEHLLDIPAYLDQLSAIGVAPDFYCYESALVGFTDELMGQIQDKRIKSSYQRYVATKGKVPCSFLTAVWYLVRLGVLAPREAIQSYGGRDFQSADQLVNVLPERYRPVEHKAAKLLNATNLVDYEQRIEVVFHASADEPTKHVLA